MLKLIAFLPLLILVRYNTADAQAYPELQKVFAVINKAGNSQKTWDSLWTSLRNSHLIPLIEGDSVAFFYKGEATSVDWVGDFNGWGSSRTFKNNGKRVNGTDVWYLKCAFPRNARLDYKILI